MTDTPNSMDSQDKYSDKSRYTFLGNHIVFATMEVAHQYSMQKPHPGFWRNLINHFGRDCFRYRGLESRSDYWRFQIMNIAVFILLVILATTVFLSQFSASYMHSYSNSVDFNTIDDSSVSMMIFTIVFSIVFTVYSIWSLLATLSATARRLHDRNMSGWWQLIQFVPYIGVIVLFVLLVLGPQYFYNRFAVADEAFFEEQEIRQRAMRG